MLHYKVTQLPVRERAALNSDQLQELNLRLGPDAAEGVIYRAVEALSVRLAAAQREWQAGHYAGLRKTVHSLRAIAEEIGLLSLGHVADTVIGCIDDGDPIAVAATLARMMRLADISLSAVWDFQDGVS